GTELDALGDWESPWDIEVPSEICIVRGYRGRVAEARDLIDRFERQFDDIADPQIHLSLLKVREHLALAEGDLGESIRVGRDADQLVDQLGVEGLSSESLACAVEARDADRVGEVVAGLIRNGRA